MTRFKLSTTVLIFLLSYSLATCAHVNGFTEKLAMANPGDSSMVKHYTEAVDSYLRGLNEKDLEGILYLYSENGSVEDPVGSTTIRGMVALHEFYSRAVTMDLYLKRTGPVRVAGVEVAFPFELIMEVNGVIMKSEIIDVFRFDENGKIASMRAFWGPSNRSVVEE